ncbi:Mechanosensitive ion channel-domain-containing protein, partial [Gorgonomyces haynaldii]
LDLLSEENGLRLAQKLFIALCPPDQSEITLDQFLPYFDSDEAAKEAFELFDRDHSGSLSLREVKQNILRIYRDRRSLYQSLGDLSQALGRLNQILYVFSILLTLLCSMPLLGISISAILPVTSLLVALSFVFGPAAGNTFNCIVFLFVYHPFDSGDRVFIDGSNYIVSELNLLTTVLIRSDGQKVYAPNNQLATKFIHNIRRSAAMAEAIEFQVSVDTPDDKLHLLEKKLNAFIKEAPKDYNPAYTSLSIYEVQDSNKMKISFWLSYKSNWQDMSRRIKPRTAFIRHLRNCMLSLGISYTLPPQPYVNMKHD